MARVTTVALRELKAAREKIAVLTAYDYPCAKLMDESGVDVILVGDTVGMVVMGRRNTLTVTMDDMVHHVRMVSAAAKRALVVGDMPFLSYQVSVEEAVHNAGRLVVEGGAQAVKAEGPADKFGDVFAAILRAGIPVMGHIGLLPQSIHQIGGYKIQGRDEHSRARLKEEAQGLAQIGCFALVLECIPADLAAEITEMVSIPTIGIGAGSACDGQVLVMHDMLGLGKETTYCKKYADLATVMKEAFVQYVREVKAGEFPAEEHTFK